jgi:hypothetical protein
VYSPCGVDEAAVTKTYVTRHLREWAKIPPGR